MVAQFMEPAILLAPLAWAFGAFLLGVVWWRRYSTHTVHKPPTMDDVRLLWPAELLPHLDQGFRWMTNRRQLRIATYRFCSTEEPVATCVLVHGYRTCARFEWLRPPAVGEPHTVLTDSVLGSLLEGGCECYMMDLQGHGQSSGHGGHRAFFESFDEVVDDVLQLIDNRRLLSNQKRRPLFLLGTSMGGAVVTRAAQRLPPSSLTGLVAISPLISMDARAGGILMLPVRMAVRILSALVPAMASGINSSLAPNPFGAALYNHETRTEPTIYQGSVRVRLLSEFANMTSAFGSQRSHAALETVRTNSLLCVASLTDTVVDPASSVLLYERVVAPNKALLLVKGIGGTRSGSMRCTVNGRPAEADVTPAGALSKLRELVGLKLFHNLTREPGGEELTRAIVAWVQEHACGAAPIEATSGFCGACE